MTFVILPYCIYSYCHLYTIFPEKATRGFPENFANFTGKPPIKQKPTTIKLIVYTYCTHTKLCHLARVSSEWKLSNVGVTHLPFSFHLVNTKTKRWNLIFTEPSCFVQLHQEAKEELIYHVDKTTHLFYENIVYINIQDHIGQKIKNILRITSASVLAVVFCFFCFCYQRFSWLIKHFLFKKV